MEKIREREEVTIVMVEGRRVVRDKFVSPKGTGR